VSPSVLLNRTFPFMLGGAFVLLLVVLEANRNDDPRVGIYQVSFRLLLPEQISLSSESPVCHKAYQTNHVSFDSFVWSDNCLAFHQSSRENIADFASYPHPYIQTHSRSTKEHTTTSMTGWTSCGFDRLHRASGDWSACPLLWWNVEIWCWSIIRALLIAKEENTLWGRLREID
jgi:hypothetical protein